MLGRSTAERLGRMSFLAEKRASPRATGEATWRFSTNSLGGQTPSTKFMTVRNAGLFSGRCFDGSLNAS